MSFLSNRNGLSVGVSPYVTLGGPSALYNFAPSLLLDFTNTETLDPRITFTRASSGTRFNSSGVLVTMGNNEPRFNYNPVTLVSNGLLIEEQRTNLVTYSEQFDNAAWIKTEVTVTANSTVAPDGTTTADLYITNAIINVEHYVFQTWTALASTAYTASVYAKANSGSVISLQFRVAPVWPNSTTIGVEFNLSTGTGAILGGNPSPTFSIASVGGGWYRCSITATTGSGGTPQFRVQTNDNGGSIYIWGAQLEAGAFPTSYIPTVAAQVTRSADVASMTGTNFSSWYNTSEGTLYADWVKNGASNFQTMAVVSDGTASNVIALTHGSGAPTNNARFDVNTAGVNQASIAIVSPSVVGTFYRTAGAYKFNDFAAVANAGTVQTDTSGTVPVVSRLNVGMNGSSDGGFLNGTIRKIAFYPLRLPNAQLQALTV